MRQDELTGTQFFKGDTTQEQAIVVVDTAKTTQGAVAYSFALA